MDGTENAKLYLGRIRRLSQEIDTNIRKKEELMEMAYSISKDTTQPHYDPNHSQHAPYERCVEKAADLEKTVTAQIDRLADMKEEAMLKIAEIDDPVCRRVLVGHYIYFKNWPEIADEMGYSERSVYRKRADALKMMGVLLEKDGSRVSLACQ